MGRIGHGVWMQLQTWDVGGLWHCSATKHTHQDHHYEFGSDARREALAAGSRAVLGNSSRTSSSHAMTACGQCTSSSHSRLRSDKLLERLR